MIDKWNNGHWKSVSMGARANRNTLVDGEVAKHTAGSITFAEHGARLTKAKKGVPPTAVELFDHTHKKRSTSDTSSSDTGNYVTSRCSRIVGEYNTSFTEKYGEDVSNYPLVDTELWQQAVGGSKKGHLFGFGYNQDPNLVLTRSCTQSTTCSSSSQEINVLWTKVEDLMEENRHRREEDERRQKQMDEWLI